MAKLLLGLGAGIAAYKTPHLVRLLVKAGHQVQVCLSPNAHHFVAPLSLQAVSGMPVHSRSFPPGNADGMEHIHLARWADVLLIAPASASLMARLAHGMADDLLTTLALAADCPRLIAPAMNQAMWRNTAMQRNLRLLAQHGWHCLPVGHGEQACGEHGPGRMLEPEALIEQLARYLPGHSATQAAWWRGRKLLLTAGPTHEAIDEVRYLGNRSSGKFGYALAAAAAALGARVELISGPTNLLAPPGVHCTRVTSAAHMLQVAQQHSWDVCIGSAAVADYRPRQVLDGKLHKNGQPLTLELEPTEDIIATLAANRPPGSLVIGFCAETGQLLERARHKLIAKGLDMVVANQVGKQLVFDQDEAEIHLVYANGQTHLAIAPKTTQASAILGAITKLGSGNE